MTFVQADDFSLEFENLDLRRLLAAAGLEAAKSKEAGRLQQVILLELHHRIKNTLAIVRAIASQSLNHADSVEQGLKAIDGRLAAMGRAHDLLIETSGRDAKLSAILETAIAPFQVKGSGQFVIGPSDADVRSEAVLPLAMTLNELCTNATKYGALAVAGGRVQVTTRISGDVAVLHWSEQGGPIVSAPKRRGFGLRLIDMSLTDTLRGSSGIAFNPDGVVCEIAVPIRTLKD
jgi:two-component sensor histidine kinase